MIQNYKKKVQNYKGRGKRREANGGQIGQFVGFSVAAVVAQEQKEWNELRARSTLFVVCFGGSGCALSFVEA